VFVIIEYQNELTFAIFIRNGIEYKLKRINKGSKIIVNQMVAENNPIVESNTMKASGLSICEQISCWGFNSCHYYSH
jgi:hypothetical protein